MTPSSNVLITLSLSMSTLLAAPAAQAAGTEPARQATPVVSKAHLLRPVSQTARGAKAPSVTPAAQPAPSAADAEREIWRHQGLG